MAGRGNRPQGPLDGGRGGDDEYRSLVFDESFVEAAHLQEFSAQERMADEEHAAVRSRAPGEASAPRRMSRQGLIIALLVVIAFGTAVYLGVRSPLPNPAPVPTQPARMATVPLAPRGAVPGATAEDLLARSPAADFRTGAEGVTLPPARSTENFTKNQVLAALTAAKEYTVASSLDPSVLTGGAERSVRLMLDPGQLSQFERSVRAPRDDGRHAATGWMVRFDPRQVALATNSVRVDGTLTARETDTNGLEVTADHVFVYAVREAGSSARSDASLFTVRREVRFRFERGDLTQRQLRIRSVAMQAGPMACSARHAAALRPLLAGESADDTAVRGTDPYKLDRPRGPVCGVLADSARPGGAGGS